MIARRSRPVRRNYSAEHRPDRRIHHFAPPKQANADLARREFRRQQPMEVIETGNRRTVEIEQYIATLDLRALGGSAWLNLQYENRRRHLPLQSAQHASV